MPVSMALAGPVSELIGLTATFLVAGLVPAVLAVIAIVVARMPADEIAHPLDSSRRPEARPASWTGSDRAADRGAGRRTVR